MLTADPPVLAQKYRLIRQLETGGMGSVWLAEHIHLESLVAVKLMSRAVAATPAGMERFLREARTAASLRSPHVVQILDYGVHDGTPFIAMELLEGETLAARLDREGRFPSWERAELVLRHVARAVGRAHDAGIIHRDLKPANIFLVRNEEEVLVKLLDFGIAKTTLEPLGASLGSNTRTGEFLGSPVYASPEQLQVSKTLDHRADIWSLGVLGYECWIGRPPFADETLVGLVLAICSHPLPVPSEHGSVPDGFDAWFARACARDVEQRFQSVREASAELRRLVAVACGLPLSLSEAESSFVSEPERWPLALPESAPAVQVPPSSPTLVRPGFSRLVRPHGDTLVMRRSQTPRPGVAASGVGLVRQRMATLVAGLTFLAVVPLLFALRAPAPAPLESGLGGLDSAQASEAVQSTPPAQSGESAALAAPAPSPRAEPAPSTEAVPQAEPAPSAAPAQSVAPLPSAAPQSNLAPHIADAPGLPDESHRAVLPPEPGVPRTTKARTAPSPRLRSSPAWLTITASAPSNVLLDGHPLGTTPLADVTIEPGVHEVTFLRDGERSTQTVPIRAGEHKRVAASLEPAAAALGDGLDEAAVQRTLRSYGPSVRDICWERALSNRSPADPTSVRVSATITVNPSGRVQSVETSGAPAAYPDLSRCIEGKVGAWTFPRARAETVVNVPFVFVVE
ncbi:MAG: protein kinase [Deltaproteobacteria bacterium]